MSDAEDPHEPLVDELRGLFARIDPVPPLVRQTAAASLGWRRLEADFAELLSDTALDAEATTFARGSEAQLRSVTFSDNEITIDVEIGRHDRELVLRGQVAPPASATIEVQRADGPTVASTRSDAIGRFRVVLASPGTIRLLVTRDAPGAALVETAWITV